MDERQEKDNTLNVVVIGAKEVDKTAIIRQMIKMIKDNVECNLMFKEYRAERKHDALFFSSPHEDGFIDENGHVLALKGDIFILVFKTTTDSDSFIEAGILLEYLTPRYKNRVILVGDCSGVSLEKRIGCRKSMDKKTRRLFGVKYIEVSCEQSESVGYLGRRILLIRQRFVMKTSVIQKLSKLCRPNRKIIDKCGKMYLAAKLPYNISYW